MATKTIQVLLEALTSQYQAKMAQAAGTTAALGKSVQLQSAAFTGAGLAAAAMGGAIALGLHHAADAAVEFEGNLTSMRTLVGLTKAETDSLGASILGLADTGRGPIELSEAMYFIVSSGIPAAEAVQVLDASARASAIGLGEVSVVADAVTSAINAYGIANLSASQAVDILAQAVNLGKLEADELAPVLGNLLPIASALGIEFEDVAGTLAVLSLRGTDAAEGATMVSGIMASLLSISPRVNETLADVGLTMQDLRDVAGEQGLYAVMLLLQDAFKGNLEGLRAIFPNIRAFRGVMSALSGDVETTTHVYEEMANAQGKVRDSFAEWSESAEAAGAKFDAAMETVAVTLGSVLLPALTTVLGIATTFAQFIATLPAPLRTTVVVLAAVAAAVLLLAGATLVLLPRLQAVKLALAEAGIQGGLFRGSIALATRAINPWTIAIGVATIGLGIWASKAAESKARVEELTGAIEADSGALGVNTQELIANRFAQEGVFDAARQFGIQLEDVVGAALGQADAIARVEDALQGEGFELDDLNEAYRDHRGLTENTASDNLLLARAADTVSGAIASAGDEADRAQQNFRDTQDAASGAEDSLSGLPPTLDDIAGGMEETVTAGEHLLDILEELSGAAIDTEEASLNWLDAVNEINRELTHAVNKQGKLTDALKPGVKGLNDQTEAGREARRAILDAANAALEHGQAVAEETGSLRRGVRVVQNHIEELIDQATTAGVSERAIRNYIDQLNLTPREIRTAIRLERLAQAQAGIESLAHQLALLPAEKRITITVNRVEAGRMHAGGLVAMHEGGALAAGEVPVVLESGEWVTDKRTTQRHAALLAALPRLHEGGVAGFGGMGAAMELGPAAVAEIRGLRRSFEQLRISVAVRADRRRFNEQLDYDTTYSGRWA